jgi:HlyD family secretion protein
MKNPSWIWSLAVIVLVAVVSYGLFWLTQGKPLPEGFVYGNGYIEGRDVKLAAERGGRVLRHRLLEGDRSVVPRANLSHLRRTSP